MERLYAASIVCSNTVRIDYLATRTDTKFTALTFFAHSKHEAMGIAIEYAQKLYPTDQGFNNHSAVVMEITTEQIYRAHELLESED